MKLILAFICLLLAVTDAVTDAAAQTPVRNQCSSGNPTNPWVDCPTSSTGPASKSGTYAAVGSNQFGLAISTNTQLTVPAGAVCAFITVETAAVRRTSDGTSASSSNGTLLPVGAAWSDCGPLASYKFTAVSGSPTLDVEYFK